MSRGDRGQSEWSNPDHVSAYLRREIPYRGLAEMMLLESLPPRIDRILDLGTGDGRLVELVRSRHRECQAVALDASPPMLDRARRRFAGDECVTVRRHDLNSPLDERAPFDAVISGLAIHHLEDQRKRALFGEIHGLLGPRGVFANLDLVRAPTTELHGRFRRAIGRPQDDPADRLADLWEQLGWLRDAGFRVAHCPFKWMQMSLLVAVR